MRATNLLTNHPVKLHNKMVYVHLESICVNADAELCLKEMFNPRIAFYAFSIAWDFSSKMPTIYSNLPLQLSYSDTRKYEGDPLSIFQGHHICGGLNLMVYAYQFAGKKQKHKKLLRKLKEKIQAIFREKNMQDIIISENNTNIWKESITRELNICINNSLRQQDIKIINIFEGLVGVDDTFPVKQKSTINHYHTMGGIELSVKV